ncbi:MAG: hypothetical protein ACK5X3_07955 [Pseudomonadota bacterium]|jgi:hypothetical protein
MTNPIRAALEKARAVYCYDAGCFCATPDDCDMKVRSGAPAKIIAAFLRALPDLSVCPRLACNYNGSGDNSATLAAAVLAAAKDQAND